jgi:chorismate mutase
MDHPNLTELREKIDIVDRELITMLAKRFDLTNKVGDYKALQHLSAVDSVREQEQSASYTQVAQAHGLNPDFIHHLFQNIRKEVVKNHRATSAQRDSRAK